MTAAASAECLGTPLRALTLACILFFGVPGRRRGWQGLLGMVALMVFADHIPSELRWWQRDQWRREWYPANSGTTAGTYTVTVTGTSGQPWKEVVFTLTVN